ncbi:MAG: O-antigen ligase family protein, partial [Clostridia bacterium]|nr:O-antigen ligase family protein [Clostridia bacterium]
SSTTYIEGIGFKGLFESGNSISAIFVLGLFILMSFIMKIDNKLYKGCMFIILVLVGIYLMTLIGTRVGLIGFIVVVLCFVISQLFEKFITKVKLNKKNFIALSGILALLIIVVVAAGSVTMQRRRHLQNMENTIIDESTGEVSNITGDLTKIRNKIINNILEDNFMTEQQKQSVLDLYDIAKKQNISNTNRRMQQLVYHIMLIKNQKNIVLILFGNGYLINTNELVLEMECPAILLNFGLLGFTCYMVPFVANLIYAFIMILKKIKKVDHELIMLFLGVGLSFIISTLSGYTFFNSSSMIIIIVANVLLKIKVENLKE